MIYRDLLSALKGLKKKDSLILVYDSRPIEAKLGYRIMEMTRYDNGKVIQSGKNTRTSGLPIEDIEERLYLTIIISEPQDKEEQWDYTTVNIPSLANKWVDYLESLPSTYLDQEIMFFNNRRGYGSNIVEAVKSGIGMNKVGIVLNPTNGTAFIADSGNEEEDRCNVDNYCRKNNEFKPYHWNEVLLFEIAGRMNILSDRTVYNPGI